MKKIVLYFLFLHLSIYLNAQITFQKIYGTGDYNYGSKVLPLQDSTYMLLCNSGGFNGMMNITLIKIDSTGQQIWSKILFNSDIEYANSFHQTSDKGFIITGYTNTGSAGAYDVLLIKTDSMGNLQWRKTFGGANWDFGNDVIVMPDHGFVITGYSNSFGSENNKIYLIRTNQNGDSLWTKILNEKSESEGNSICITKSNDFIICGASRQLNKEFYDLYIVKTDQNGNIIYSNTFGDTLNDKGFCIKNAHSSGYIISGFSQNVSMGNEDAYILNIDENGNKIWEQRYGYPADSRANSICLASNNTYVCAGTRTSNGNKDVYLLKMDSLGSFLAGRIYGSDQEETILSIEPCNDGGFIMIGNSLGYLKQNTSSIYIVKTDSTTLAADYNSIKVYTDMYPEIYIYPNPFHSFLTIEFNSSTNKNMLFELTTLTGEIVYQTEIHSQSNVSLKNFTLSPGVYLYKIFNQNAPYPIKFGKLIKQ